MHPLISREGLVVASLALQVAFTLAVWQAGLLSPPDQGTSAKQALSPAWLFAPFAGIKRVLVTVSHAQDGRAHSNRLTRIGGHPCRCLCWAWR